MQYAEVAPCAALAPYVKTYWLLRGHGHATDARQRILPDGSFEAIFHFGDRFRQNGVYQPRAMMIGEICRPVVIEPSGFIDVLGVRFRAAGIAAFLRMPARELRDSIIPLDEIWKGAASEMADAAAGDRVQVLERMLVRRLREVDRLPFVATAQLRIRNGAISIRQLASIVGTTERTLERVFDRTVGMSPKTYARLARFRAFVNRGENEFYDDPHLCHEFRAFAGVTPTEFEREQHPIDDAFRGTEEEAEG